MCEVLASDDDTAVALLRGLTKSAACASRSWTGPRNPGIDSASHHGGALASVLLWRGRLREQLSRAMA
eukprot:7045159-Pyramimonas_sp.AAC.1